jgi:hypothetical protein
MRFLILALFFTGCAQQDFTPCNSGSKSLLVIGDSISIGYTPHLSQQLCGEYRVSHSPGNAQNSTHTLANIDIWEPGQSDIIVWNNGIWDTSLSPIYGNTPAQYEQNLIDIANKLKTKAPRVIFLTTTRLYPNGHNDVSKVDLFNDSAWRVLPGLGVEVYDLYTLSLQFEPYDKTHYQVDGYSAFSNFIVDKIRN